MSALKKRKADAGASANREDYLPDSTNPPTKVAPTQQSAKRRGQRTPPEWPKPAGADAIALLETLWLPPVRDPRGMVRNIATTPPRVDDRAEPTDLEVATAGKALAMCLFEIDVRTEAETAEAFARHPEWR